MWLLSSVIWRTVPDEDGQGLVILWPGFYQHTQVETNGSGQTFPSFSFLIIHTVGYKFDMLNRVEICLQVAGLGEMFWAKDLYET